ncbi:hypothetical protein BU26DRAFT_173114 [Trematosphaeria pertusa]|uniref:Uncharacterized protein n=1 Tax=Trematosphaeria pertusa TaxID=390896 RepID=A0A6A6HUY8_9PLEO|nr:uncharacterized protein BU26DRAFT_173114 [Trematosphaeria pertusa]KAF2241572.1 hypothetical protein BU26DRAFT_173114 [Trematosphaeria pertusa]
MSPSPLHSSASSPTHARNFVMSSWLVPESPSPSLRRRRAPVPRLLWLLDFNFCLAATFSHRQPSRSVAGNRFVSTAFSLAETLFGAHLLAVLLFFALHPPRLMFLLGQNG